MLLGKRQTSFFSLYPNVVSLNSVLLSSLRRVSVRLAAKRCFGSETVELAAKRIWQRNGFGSETSLLICYSLLGLRGRGITL
jgi:hypothetical protein